jgi:hypothetical protein
LPEAAVEQEAEIPTVWVDSVDVQLEEMELLHLVKVVLAELRLAAELEVLHGLPVEIQVLLGH